MQESLDRTIGHQQLLVALVTIADGDFLARPGGLLSRAHQGHVYGDNRGHATAIQLQCVQTCETLRQV